MTQPLDIFSIAFGSEGLKQFEKQLKDTETNLDKAEKEVTRLEKKFEDLSKSNKDNVEELVKVDGEIRKAKEDAAKFANELKVLQGRGENQIMALKKNFSGLVKTIGLLAIVGTTVRKSLQFYEQAEQLDFLAEKTGIAADKLQELGNTSRRFGGNTESTATSIENIRTNKEAYTKARIRIENDPTQTLENVARKMETLSNDRAKWDLANSLGIDEATTRMLIQGVEKYNASLKKGAKYKLYTKEDIQRMRDYRQIQQDIRMGLDRMWASIYQMFLPAITLVSKIIKKITDWTTEREGIVKITGVFVAVAAAIGGIVVAVKSLSGALAFLKTNPFALKIIAGIALITLLIAAINDLIVFVQGGESVIGDVLEKLGLDTELLRKDILAGIESLKRGFNSFVEGLKNVGASIANIFNKVKEVILGFWNGLPDPIKKLLGGAALMTSMVVNPLGTAGAMTAVGIGQHVMSKYKKDPNNAVPQGAQTAYYNTQSQNANTTNNSKNIANNRNNNINVGNINIQTQANNPQQVAQEVGYIMTSLDNAQRA